MQLQAGNPVGIGTDYSWDDAVATRTGHPVRIIVHVIILKDKILVPEAMLGESAEVNISDQPAIFLHNVGEQSCLEEDHRSRPFIFPDGNIAPFAGVYKLCATLLERQGSHFVFDYASYMKDERTHWVDDITHIKFDLTILENTCTTRLLGAEQNYQTQHMFKMTRIDGQSCTWFASR